MRYSHVYVEKGARAYPLTDAILSKLQGSVVIDIDHYKDVFDRPRQDIVFQKENPCLILAVRTGAREVTLPKDRCMSALLMTLTLLHLII